MIKKENQDVNYKIVYSKPSLWRIFAARFLDLMICSIPSIILILLYPAHDLISAVIVTVTNFFVIFIYFILLPFFLKGNTAAKWMLNLRMKNLEDKKITFKICFIRELYFLLIPLFFQIICQIIIIIIFNYTNPGNNDPLKNGMIVGLFIQNISYLFFVIWFIYILITIKLQEDHQAAIDYKMKINIFHLTKKYNQIDVVDYKNNREKNLHIHLEDKQPGNIDENILKEIIEDEEYEDKF